ncbi:MAG: hypothetical protein ABI580_12520 [Burkholderiaceae bacterium]
MTDKILHDPPENSRALESRARATLSVRPNLTTTGRIERGPTEQSAVVAHGRMPARAALNDPRIQPMRIGRLTRTYPPSGDLTGPDPAELAAN